MTTPIYPQYATSVTKTSANPTLTGQYCNSADALRIQRSALSIAAMLCDFRLTGVSFGTAPVAGSLQLVLIDRDAAGNQGPTPAATLVPARSYTLSPVPAASNALTGWIMSVNAVPISPDQDVWIYNNGTAQTLSSGWTLTAMPWSPGT